MRPLPTPMRSKMLAAADLFADQGLDATKMEDVAAATGVPKATLYYYFEGKEEILSFLFAEILDEVTHAIRGAVETKGDAAERLSNAIEAHLGVFERFPTASRALQFDLGRAARMPHIAERVKTAFVEPVHDLLVEGARDGSLRQLGDPWLVATAILGAITTTGINFLTIHPKRKPARVARDLVARDLIGFVLSGAGA
jgi:TetR/AcrR family transcriptional regulator